MHVALRSLAAKLTLIIVLVEIVTNGLLGGYYLSHFSTQADQRLTSQIKVPGILMNKGLLNYDAISNRDTMKQILGDTLDEAMVFGFDKTVYQSINASDIGENVDRLPRIELGAFKGGSGELVFNGKDKSGSYMASITPIFSAAGQAPFLFAYIKISTQSLQQEKNLLLLFILGGSLLTIILTSGAIFFLMRVVMLGNIRKLRLAAEMVSQGKLGPEVTKELPVTRDELGRLSDAFRTMIDRLQSTYRDLAEKQASLRASINSLTLGFIMVDHNHDIVNLNPAARRLFGDALDVHNPNLSKIQDQIKTGIDLSKSINECIVTGRPQEFKEIIYKDRFLHILLAPIALEGAAEDDRLGAVMLFEDVTEERVMARSKDEFFSIASHELRTPLTAIRGNTSLIQSYYKDQLKDVQLNELVGDIHESSVRLISIVNDFLDASRLEQGKMQFNPEAFSIEEVIEKVVYELGAVIHEKGIYLKMETDLGSLPLVWADKNHVKQVVYNLVGNAAKFVDKGGVTVEAKVEAKFIKVYVRDTGKGISAENQQILFHKFQQATSSIVTRDNTRGTGLGLYISKLLIEQMGGKIGLEHSEEGRGSTFSFTLPVATKAQLKPPNPPATDATAAK